MTIPTMSRRGFLKASAATGALAMGLPAVAAYADEKPINGGTLRVGLSVTPVVLNPMLTRLNSEYMLAELLYSGLTTLAPNMAAAPDLATEWSSNKEATEWHFTLRQNATFSNGKKVTSADVVASFEKLLDPATAAPGSKNLGPIDKVAADGDYGVVITTKAPFADLPVSLAYPTAKIVPAEVIAKDFDSLKQKPVGSGPFRLTNFQADQLSVVEKNPDYFIPGEPHLDRIEIHTYPDYAGATSALLAKEIDLLVEIPPSDYGRMAKAKGIDGLRTPSGRFLDVVMDCSRKPFDDVRVRQALALTIDRKAMVELVAEGYGTPGNDTPINSAYRYYDDAPLKQPDIAKAKKLLAEAGYPDGLKIELVASVKPSYRSAMAVVVKQMAQAAGFDISVKTMDHPTYLAKVWKKGLFYVGFYNMQPTEGAIFNLLFTSDASWNGTKWENKTFDKYVNAAGATTDEAQRRRDYDDAQALMRKEVPAMIPCFFDLLAAKQDYVQGYVQNPRGANFALQKVWLTAKAPKR